MPVLLLLGKSLQLGALMLLCCLSAAGPLAAEPEPAGDLVVTQAWSRAMLPGSATGIVFLQIDNRSYVAYRLTGALCDRAQMVHLHQTRQVADRVSMEALTELVIPPGQQVELEPRGLHLMLDGIGQPLSEGERFTLSLEFSREGSEQPTRIDLEVVVGGMSAMAFPEA